MNKLMRNQFVLQSAKLKEHLTRARKVTICLDGWAKKSLSVSYLGISACYFDPTTSKPCHSFLNLSEIPHPHTGEMLAACLTRCFEQWGITEKQVLLIVTDNGSNMVKAIRLVQEQEANAPKGSGYDVEVDDSEEDVQAQEAGPEVGNMGSLQPELEGFKGPESNSEDDDFDEVDEIGEESDEGQLDLPLHVPFRRMPCMAHTLQLVIKLPYAHYDVLLTKTRHIVARIRKSSVAVGKLIAKCGKSAITDCTTRWNSTHHMIKRLLAIKTSVNEVLTEIGTLLSTTQYTLTLVTNTS